MTRRKILLIDDDRLQHRLLQQFVRAFHGEAFELEGATTYEDGLARLLTGGYAVCLLDYQLGPRDGLELIEEAGRAGCPTPIIFLTADTSEQVDEKAMNAGALDYLVKGEISARSLERSLRYALKLAETLAELKRLATRDALTGLLNRREYERIMGEECDRSARFGRPLSLLIFDLDHFKAVNDEHGHAAGDAVLSEVAARLAGQVREFDRVARVGGEEIAVVLVEADAAAGREIGQRLVAVVQAMPVELPDGRELAVTISAGLASMPGHATGRKGLAEAADRALYAAKRAGRNRLAVAGD